MDVSWILHEKTHLDMFFLTYNGSFMDFSIANDFLNLVMGNLMGIVVNYNAQSNLSGAMSCGYLLHGNII